MSGTRFVVAIDGGSQSTKVLVLDEHGAVHAAAQQPLRATVAGADGTVVHPDDDLWDSLVAACRAALEAFGGDRSAIVGVGLCTIRFCRALLDGDGRLVEPVMSWMDQRVSRPHVPDLRVRFVTTSSGYLTHRLTGATRDSLGNQQGMWPFDPATGDWSIRSADYERTGMDRAALFDLVEPGALLGRLTDEAARAIGLPPGLPVYATANDKAVEALGSGLIGSDVTLLSLGTYIAAMATGGRPDQRDPAYWVNTAAVPGQHLFESHGIRRGMWTVSWWRQTVGGLTDDELNAGAREIPPGSEGLYAVLDWLPPDDAPHRRGALVGFGGRHGRFHVYRAILEGIALTMADHTEAMERAVGRRPGTVIVSGGGARSDLMMQIVAAVLDRTVVRPRLIDAAGVGSAVCAFVGAGVFPGWEQGVSALVHPDLELTPDDGSVRAYRGVAERHAVVRRGVDALLESLTST